MERQVLIHGVIENYVSCALCWLRELLMPKNCNWLKKNKTWPFPKEQRCNVSRATWCRVSHFSDSKTPSLLVIGHKLHEPQSQYLRSKFQSFPKKVAMFTWEETVGRKWERKRTQRTFNSGNACALSVRSRCWIQPEIPGLLRTGEVNSRLTSPVSA